MRLWGVFILLWIKKKQKQRGFHQMFLWGLSPFADCLHWSFLPSTDCNARDYNASLSYNVKWFELRLCDFRANYLKWTSCFVFQTDSDAHKHNISQCLIRLLSLSCSCGTLHQTIWKWKYLDLFFKQTCMHWRLLCVVLAVAGCSSRTSLQLIWEGYPVFSLLQTPTHRTIIWYS